MSLPSPGKGETKVEGKKAAEQVDGREVRLCANAELRVASEEERAQGQEMEIVGYAAKFNQVAVIWPGLREQIAPGAFAQTIKEGDDVRSLFNHNADIVLGRSTAGTLALEEDDVGLHIRGQLPDTQPARDLYENIRVRNVTQMSFAFKVRGETIIDQDDGTRDRTITNAKLYDVSPVTYPAYENTEVDVRAQDTTVVAKMMKDWAAKTDITKTAEPEPKAADKDDGPKLAKDDPRSLRLRAHVQELRESCNKEK